MRSLICFSVLTVVRSAADLIYTLPAVSHIHLLAYQRNVKDNSCRGEDERQLNDTIQGSNQSEISTEFDEILSPTILPRGNCVGKFCASDTNQQSESKRSSFRRATRTKSIKTPPNKDLNQVIVTDRSHSSNESGSRRISPPWPSSSRTPGTSDHYRSASRNRDLGRSSIPSHSSSQSPIPGPRSPFDTNSPPRMQSLSRTSSSSSFDDPNDMANKIVPGWSYRNPQVSRATSSESKRSADEKDSRPEISVTMKGPGIMSARKGLHADWMDLSPENNVVHRVQKDQVMHKTWSDPSHVSTTIATGKGGTATVQAMGRYVEGIPYAIGTDLSAADRNPGRVIMHAWRPPMNNELRQMPTSVSGKRATYVYPNNAYWEGSRGVLASSEGHSRGSQAGLIASAEGRMSLEIDARKHDVFWPDGKKSYAHRYSDLDIKSLHEWHSTTKGT